MHAVFLSAILQIGLAAGAEPTNIDEKYPLDPQLKVLAGDVRSDSYRKLVVEKMLSTDLAAEWQRVATADNADSFLAKHGGRDKVLADPDLKQAYERRVQIRDDFLQLMRDGYRRHKQVPPFDKGEKAELAGTTTRAAAGKRLALATVLPAPDADRHWPRFRGPSGQGTTMARTLPLHWDRDGKNVVWQTPIPGQGNSSPIVWGDRIFLTSSTPDGAERFVHSLSAADGRLLWSRAVAAKTPEKSVRDKNGYASSTPATDGERVVSFFGTGGLVCHDFDGKLLWSFDEFQSRTGHGPGSSPLLYKNLVILIQDQNQADSICMAFDKRTGKPVWQTPRKKAMTWCTPVVVRVGDRDELIFAGGETVKAYDPATGKELWSFTGPTAEVVPTIVVGKDLIYSASGRNGPTIGLVPGGSGDVTGTHRVWRTVRGGPHVPSPILANGRVFTVNDTGIFTCLNAETGKLVWQGRVHDQFSASPIEAGGMLYFPGESGVTYVVKAADTFEVVARNALGAPILASPAVTGERLLLRTRDALVCIASEASTKASRAR